MGATSLTPFEFGSPTASTPSTTTGDTILELAVSDEVLEIDSTMVALQHTPHVRWGAQAAMRLRSQCSHHLRQHLHP